MYKKIEVRQSTIHGRGVFALCALKKGEKIIEYKGERIDWEEAERRHPHDPTQPNHTFYFSLEDGLVIDGRVKGNAAKWINHACKPNCEAREIVDKRECCAFLFSLNLILHRVVSYFMTMVWWLRGDEVKS